MVSGYPTSISFRWLTVGQRTPGFWGITQAVYNSRWHEQLISWLASLTLENEMRQEFSLPQVVCEYEDVFPNELLGLPPT